MTDLEKLFVYGSLAPGESNNFVLNGIDGTWISGQVKGQLKQQGWGAHIGFPGLILDEQGETVEGLVFSSQHLKDHWERVDDFEGEEYVRILTEVQTNDGSVEAYVYALKRG